VPVVEIVGVYPVQAREPCHLVELLVGSCEGPFDLTLVTQRDRDQPRANWQVPYAEKMLDPSGERVEWDLWDRTGDEALWRGDVRLVFFFHYLDTELPLVTPFGDIRVPTPTERPARLDGIEYEEPC
jgi:hypothetical protein